MRLLLVGELPDRESKAWAGFNTWWASSHEQASALLDQRPDVVVAATTGWGPSWIAELPPEARPPVLIVGCPRDQFPLADEWMPSINDAAELSVRLRLAVLRGRDRRRAARRAMVDPLTGLPNRRAAIRGLLHAVARARRSQGAVSLILVDLDHFKEINDRFGHDVGDRLLRNVGAVLARVVRRDELCARIGGDEFALIIAGPLRAAQSAARRVRLAMARAGIRATIVAGELRSGEQIRDLYRRTDAYLNAAKHRRPRATSAASSSYERNDGPPAAVSTNATIMSRGSSIPSHVREAALERALHRDRGFRSDGSSRHVDAVLRGSSSDDAPRSRVLSKPTSLRLADSASKLGEVDVIQYQGPSGSTLTGSAARPDVVEG